MGPGDRNHDLPHAKRALYLYAIRLSNTSQTGFFGIIKRRENQEISKNEHFDTGYLKTLLLIMSNAHPRYMNTQAAFLGPHKGSAYTVVVYLRWSVK